MQEPQQQGNPGMSPAVAEALQRRGMSPNPSQMGQVSPGAPMANPVDQPLPTSELPQNSPQGVPKQEFSPQTQDDIIVQGLIKQLTNNNSLEKEKNKMNQVPQMGNMGGM